MLKNNNFSLFFLISLFSIIIVLITNNYLKTTELFYNSYIENFSSQQVKEIIRVKEKWFWTGYIIIPLSILIRTHLVSFCLSIGLFFFEEKRSIKFRKILKITLFGEIVFALSGCLKFVYFYFFKIDFTINDLENFQPLSYINFLDISKIEPCLLYPLQTINLFEIAYFLLLVFGLHKLLKNNYWKSFEIVAVSYGTGLIIWIGLLMFFTLNIS